MIGSRIFVFSKVTTNESKTLRQACDVYRTFTTPIATQILSYVANVKINLEHSVRLRFFHAKIKVT